MIIANQQIFQADNGNLFFFLEVAGTLHEDYFFLYTARIYTMKALIPKLQEKYKL